MRVMSFADYKLARYSSVSYDPWLFSPKLQAELAVWQNRHLLEQHPVFGFSHARRNQWWKFC